MEFDKRGMCPCRSGKKYLECCHPFHQGKNPETALELMRARFAAYALNLPRYIIGTTHPASHQFSHEPRDWTRKISEFSLATQFKDLEILGFQQNGSFAEVTFTAYLLQGKKDVSFTEKSVFEKVKGRWLYRSAQLEEGRAPNLMTQGQLRILPIAYYGDPILRRVADPILNINQDIKDLVEEMVETMDACDGIGLAAPQVHHSIQLFIIRKAVEGKGGRVEFRDLKVFINPQISLPSVETWIESEGCLSIPSIHGDVERPKEITIEYLDLSGNQVKERVAGWEARVILHENDHINGVLFIDRLDPAAKKNLEPFLQNLYNKIHDGTEL